MLLLTGFEPFAHYSINPSWHAVAACAERWPDRVVARLLPVDYWPAREALLAAIEEINPTAVLCTGLAAGDVFRMETRARKPVQFESLPGPDILEGTWPWAQTEAALQQAGMPVRYSNDAGQYVCESTYWSLLNHGMTQRHSGCTGFLHVPAISIAFTEHRIRLGVLAVAEAYRTASAATSAYNDERSA